MPTATKTQINDTIRCNEDMVLDRFSVATNKICGLKVFSMQGEVNH